MEKTLIGKYEKILWSNVFCQVKHKKWPLRADELENKICKRFILQWFFDATKLNMIYLKLKYLFLKRNIHSKIR